MPDRRTETVFREIKVFECAAHKYSGGVDGLIERRFAINQQHAQALFTHQPGALQTRQAGADYDNIVLFHLLLTNRQTPANFLFVVSLRPYLARSDQGERPYLSAQLLREITTS